METDTRIVVVDTGAFGMPDMFPNFAESKEVDVENETFVVEVTTYLGSTETFDVVEEPEVHAGFVRIVQPGRVISFNAGDVTRMVSYHGAA